ncbi:MAG: hypothetical protein ISS33_05975 [Candidatus Omnitrophica bacterium]|nr:hypothetical protein [Candidatus Omnitrophota bacterium]
MRKDKDREIALAEILGSIEDSSTQQLTLYIPDKDKTGKKIKGIHGWVKEAQKVLTIVGGGSTTLPPADGTWLDPDKKIANIDDLKDEDIVWEKTTLVCTYINPDEFEENLNVLRKFLHKFGKQTNQGEVVFEFDGRFFRIREYD